MAWPEQPPLRTSRFDLLPLRVDHAAEMTGVLADPSLFDLTGGSPPTTAELRRRYAAQVAGAPGGDQWWLNWVLRHREHGVLHGYVQATVERRAGRSSADVAWVVGTAHQRRGTATEAAWAMADWLATQGVETVVAHIHPDNEASRVVAARIGMHPTAVEVDGEVRWERGRPLPGVAQGRRSPAGWST